MRAVTARQVNKDTRFYSSEDAGNSGLASGEKKN
jgi:hypothetical protein